MSYNITKSNTVTIGTIADGTYDNTATSLTLVGRNFSNYGQFMTNNLVRLLENSAYNVSPSNPLAGQLWWDTGTSRLKVYTGSDFKNVGSCTSQATAPTTTVAGDLWWDSAEEQLYIYNGANPYSIAGWILVGPAYKKTNGKSGAIWEQIQASDDSFKNVVSIYLDGVRTAIISDEAFTPKVAITGYTSVQVGYTMSTTNTVWGTANNASYLGNQPAANYLRSDTSDSTDGALTIANNSGLTVGLSSNLQITTTTGGDASIKNTKSNGDINFYANVAGTNTLAFGIDGATGTAALLSATLSGSLTLASGASVTGALNVTGTGSYSGALTAPTQSVGTADTTVATTEFVINNSGFLKNKIYSGTSGAAATTYIEVNQEAGATPANLTIKVGNVSVATASNVGINLANGATAVTQAVSHQSNIALHQHFGNSYPGDSKIATTNYVARSTEYWSGSAKFVSTLEPNVAIGSDGDFWFQIEA
jgi:hypothetical protein